MKVGRMLPPAAAPLAVSDLGHALVGAVRPRAALAALEGDIKRVFGVEHAFLVSSGTAALTLALRALAARSSRREVVIPAYTCFSVPAAVIEAGCRPVLCDIDPATFDYDHLLLEETLSASTLAVVAHHLFGAPAGIDGIRGVCARLGILVVEDAAQAMGAEDGGRRLGTIGDAGVFSLGRGKNITCGSGGILVTRSAAIAAAIRAEYERLEAPSIGDDLVELARLIAMAIFIRPSLYWVPAALPGLGLGRTVFPRRIRVARLSGMKAGFLRRWRRRLARANRARSAAAAYFRGRLPLPLPAPAAHPYLRLPVVLRTTEERDTIYAHSQRRGLGIGMGYPASVADIPEVHAVCPGGQFPCARRVARSLITLPTHEWVSDRDRRAIADLCRDVAAA